MEAFSDGVIAILITIMVLELPKPAGGDWGALAEDWPVLLGYVLSFVFLGIYWNNHHHTFQAVSKVSGAALWANLHLLFWLSLVPFVTGWMSEEWVREGRLATAAVVTYGAVLFGAGGAFFILQQVLIRQEGPGSTLAAAVGPDLKGKVSSVVYSAGILLTFVNPVAGIAAYVAVALLWFIPDRRVERQLAHQATAERPDA